MPFNVIPTPENVLHLFRRICRLKKQPRSNDLEQHATPANGPKGHTPIAMISNGQAGNGPNANHVVRRKSIDVNQTLTYRKVMERVIKRFLLHKQREEQDEIREGDFEELKQDIQMLRFEMMNRLEETRDDLAKNSLLLNEGVLVVGELLSSLARDSNPLIKDNFHLFKRNFYATLHKVHPIDSGTESAETTTTTSLPNILQHLQAEGSMSSSNSAPSLSSNLPNDTSVNPTQMLRQLSATHITLSQIAEDDETAGVNDNDDGEEEEVEGRHMSVQTSADNEGGERRPANDRAAGRI